MLDSSMLRNNPELSKHISEDKLDMLGGLLNNSGNLTPEALIPFLLNSASNAANNGKDFTNAETELIINVLKKNMSPKDVQKIDMIRNIAGMMTANRQADK